MYATYFIIFMLTVTILFTTLYTNSIYKVLICYSIFLLCLFGYGSGGSRPGVGQGHASFFLFFFLTQWNVWMCFVWVWVLQF